MAEEMGSQLGKCPACRTEGVRLRDVGGLMICEKCSSKRFSNKVRKSIQEAFERQQDQKRKEAWTRRIDVAKRGVKLYEDGKIPEALRCFRDYISILELKYSVGQGGLRAGHFDAKKDAGELLLIAGIYWDLAKIYDQMKGHQQEMRLSLNKFIEFSIEKPHIVLASEAIRRYIGSGQARNVNDFKNAHELVLKNMAKCFIATALYGPVSIEVQDFRLFRDQFLMRYSLGRRFVAFYYKVSPPLARWLLRNRVAKELIRPVFDVLHKLIKKLTTF